MDILSEETTSDISSRKYGLNRISCWIKKLIKFLSSIHLWSSSPSDDSDIGIKESEITIPCIFDREVLIKYNEIIDYAASDNGIHCKSGNPSLVADGK